MASECETGKEPAESNINGYPQRRMGVRRMDIIQLIKGRKAGRNVDTSSVTLVRTPTSTVVMDSGSGDIREELLGSIENNGIMLEKVNVLVTSRADKLHTGNDDLFVHALQHLRIEDWSKVAGAAKRRIAINNRYHWIDRYLRLDVLPFPDGGSLALLIHVPKREEDLEPASRHLAGKVVLLAGFSVESKDHPDVVKALDRIRRGDVTRMDHSRNGFRDLEELLAYCDHVVPAYGDMFNVRE
ncbi:MAG: hypothetical protein ACMUIE_07835 [Thermoplasmatota archaeon]